MAFSDLCSPTATAAYSSLEFFHQVHINFTAKSRVLSSTLDTWSTQHGIVETNGFFCPLPLKKQGIGSGSPKKLPNQYLDLWICVWSSFLSSWKLNIMGLGYGNCSACVFILRTPGVQPTTQPKIIESHEYSQNNSAKGASFLIYIIPH